MLFVKPNFKQFLVLAFFLFAGSMSFAQTTIWSEDFSGYADGVQSGAGSGTSTATWSTNDGNIDVRTISGNKVLRGSNTSTTSYWTTNPITVNGYSNVTFSLDVDSGGGLDSGIDVFRIQYRIDGGSYVEIENTSGDTSPSEPIQPSYNVSGLSGNTIDFRITMYNTTGAEFYEIDNFLVEGTLGASSCNTISSSPGSSISDGVTLNSNLSGFASGTITDVNVTLNISHTWDSDLDISLTSPDGTTVLLSDDNGGSGNNYTNTIFDDASGTSIIAGSAPFTGTFSPEGNLSDFMGEEASGTWTLSIFDDAFGDQGTLNSFSIEVCTSVPSVPRIDITDLAVNEDAGNAVFTVTHIDLDASGAFSVNYSIIAGSATQGVDYTTGSGFYTGTLNFNGTVSDTEQITVNITDDFDVEPDETYSIQFTSTTDASVDITDTATGTINNDDIAAVIQVGNETEDEDDGPFIFTVTHTGGDRPVAFTVDYTITAVSASEGVDYTTGSGFYTGTLNFDGTAGDTDQITINITDDTAFEISETFTISFSATNDASVDISDTATGSITDNEVILTEVPLTLFNEFNGYYDYSVTGGSMRDVNNPTYCSIKTTSTVNGLTSDIPPTGTIVQAYLLWSHSNQAPDTQVTFEGQTVNADFVYGASMSGGRLFYGMMSDVTSIISGLADPTNNVYDFTDLDVDNTSNFADYCGTGTVLGGWSLLVFYEEDTLPAVSINMYHGFKGESNTSRSYTLDGFYAIGSTDAKTTVLSWEGDTTLDGSSAGTTNPNGEALSVTNQGGTTTVLSGDGGQTGNNAYNSTIYNDTPSGTVNYTDSWGVDLDTFDISSYISAADSEITVNVDTGQDFVIANMVLVKVPSNLIVGNIFEDINYGGGFGRDMATSSGAGVEDARLELYDSLNVFQEFTLSDSSGEYSFGGMANGDYSIRVVNNTVNSTRGGGTACGSCMPVQTFLRNYTNATGFADIDDRVGGLNPSTADVGSGTLTNAKTVSMVNIISEGVVGLDFGFNFNTIVNTNEDGQGSLEQFIVNADNLDETGLDIVTNGIFDPATGEDISIFMIPPTGDTQGRIADTNYNGSYFDIFLSSSLPDIADDNTSIDGRTQTAYSGNTNSGTIGSGGSTVGTSGNILPNYELPEIQVHSNNGDVIVNEGNSTTVRNISIYADNRAGIRIDDGSATISNNLLGVNALGANAGDINYGVEITDGTVIIDSNYIATNTDAGILIDGGTSTIAQNNHITANGDDRCFDNVTIENGSGIVIQRNLIENAASLGIDGDGISGNITISENTIIGSGQDGGNCNGNVENAGILLDGSNSTISNNVISANGGAGIVLAGGNTTGNLISQNSIYTNGTASPSLGIDLDQSDDAGDGVTLNDSGDVDNGPNGSTNFPIISSAYYTGSNLVVEGWSRPGATIELFLTDINQGSATVGDNELGMSTDYGEGQVYLATIIEGSGADSDSGTSPYTDVDGNSDNTNKFKFNLPMTGVSIGNFITSTATISNSTSEFSPFSTLKAYSIITNRRITYRVRGN